MSSEQSKLRANSSKRIHTADGGARVLYMVREYDNIYNFEPICLVSGRMMFELALFRKANDADTLFVCGI